ARSGDDSRGVAGRSPGASEEEGSRKDTIIQPTNRLDFLSSPRRGTRQTRTMVPVGLERCHILPETCCCSPIPLERPPSVIAVGQHDLHRTLMNRPGKSYQRAPAIHRVCLPPARVPRRDTTQIVQKKKRKLAIPGGTGTTRRFQGLLPF